MPEKISKYTGVGDFVGLGQTSASPYVRSRVGTQIRILSWRRCCWPGEYLTNSFLINNKNNLIYETFSYISNGKKRKLKQARPFYFSSIRQRMFHGYYYHNYYFKNVAGDVRFSNYAKIFDGMCNS